MLFGEWDRRRLLRGSLAALAAIALVFAVGAIAFGDPFGFLGEQGSRGLQEEAVATIPWQLRELVTGEGPARAIHYGAWEIAGSTANAVAGLLKWATLAALAGAAAWWSYRARAIRGGREDLSRSAVSLDFVFTVVLLLVVTSRVLSTQYMIWLLGLAAVVLTAGGRPPRPASLAGDRGDDPHPQRLRRRRDQPRPQPDPARRDRRRVGGDGLLAAGIGRGQAPRDRVPPTILRTMSRWETTSRLEADVSPAAVWTKAYANAEAWPEWNVEIKRASLGGPLALGAQAKIVFGTGLRLRFRVVEFEDGRLFTDEARLPGARMGHRHLIEPTESGGSHLSNTIYIEGPLTPIWRRILGPAAARSLSHAQQAIVSLAVS